jgi:hypothetical protein
LDQPFAAYEGDEPYVFVCYSHEDTGAVYPEIAWLQMQGINVWYDEEIAPGELWSQEIADSLDRCSQFFVFITPRSAQSRHCLNEVQYAVSHGKQTVRRLRAHFGNHVVQRERQECAQEQTCWITR